MQKLAEIMLEYWDAPWFATLRGFLIGALVVCVIWVVCELRKHRIDLDEEEEHGQEQEAEPYGGFIRWDMETAPQQVAYAAVTEQLIKCGVLKVQIEDRLEDRPTGTVCNYAIRAVKWND